MKTLKGNELTPSEQAKAKAMFVHRYTMEHKPNWANQIRPCGNPYRPQFASDAEWLANTTFHVTNAGIISERHNHCESSGETWPQGK